ncbi:efflux RND transporter periplasmic adaptor subunit [Luteithermobacter gelatinilyticus]|uniref:efflux RND transporter periplasmic adaptor subunit n=1 Tax=Luteithermobacter gelatinilyticus TaxID=2582913 RepID=UPI00143D7033|nr:efflux RND transporter periplasmic adaptor subunit [Luteithermobacter gelatinilyticus]
MKKKTLTLLAVCLTAGSALPPIISPVHAQEIIALDETKFDTLGIRTIRPEPAENVWSMAYPSQVTIPNDQIRIITSLYPGLIKTLYVAEGDKVKRGQKLAEIASPAFLDAQQNYLDAVAALEMERKNFARDSLLLEEGIISEKRYLAARTALTQAENNHARQKQALMVSGIDASQISRLDQTRQIFGTLPLTAPFDGVILEQMGRPGEKIDEASALYSLGQTSPIWLQIHVPLSFRQNLTPGGRVKVADPSLEGRIISIGRMIHEADQGILVRAEIREEANKLIPGQFVRVHLEQKFDTRTAFRVPRQAVVREGSRAYVFRQAAQGFALLSVSVLAEEQDAMIIEAELAATDRLAISGIGTLKGMWQGLGSEE